MDPGADRVERAILRWAREHHRIIERERLLELGLGADAIDYRLRRGRLHREFAGVYAVGTPAMTAWERAYAAVVACGPGSLLADLAALALWEFRPWPSRMAVLTPNHRRPPGIVVHRSCALTSRDRARRHGIPVTSPARAVLDCARLLEAQPRMRVINDALHSGHLTRAALAKICTLHPSHPGAKLIRPFYATADGPSRSDWEDDFPAWCVNNGLPRPLTSHPIGPYEVDAVFLRERLIVELDGWGSHSGRDRFEADRERDAANLLAGFATVRVTWRRRFAEAEREAERLRRILELRRVEVAAVDGYAA